MKGKDKGEPLSIDHLSELTRLLADDSKLERALGFAKPARSNTWGDLVRWGYAEAKPHSADAWILTERGKNMLRRVATALAGAGYFRASCPGCKKTYRVEEGTDLRCDCNEKCPFKLVPDSINELVEGLGFKKKAKRKK